MPYKILIEKKAEKDLEKIPKEIQRKIISKILELKNSPRLNAGKISGSNNYYRIRIGDYRAVYEIKNKKREIILFIIRHRKEVYKKI